MSWNGDLTMEGLHLSVELGVLLLDDDVYLVCALPYVCTPDGVPFACSGSLQDLNSISQ